MVGEGGGGPIFWKTPPETALLSTYVSTLWLQPFYTFFDECTGGGWEGGGPKKRVNRVVSPSLIKNGQNKHVSKIRTFPKMIASIKGIESRNRLKTFWRK